MITENPNRIYLLDTTLRDGAQSQGVDFNVRDKIAIATALDALGIDYVEGGWPGANPTDDAFFANPPKFKNSKFVAFGMTRRPGRSAENDPGLAPLLQAKTDANCYVGKSWDFQVEVALNIELDENVKMIADTIAATVAVGKEAMFDAEHFFDGFKANPDFALRCIQAAYDAGARWVVLCDTNGGTLPHEVTEIVTAVQQHIPGSHLGAHFHNDTENAVANSLAAVMAGVRQIQGTLNGLGERCGNANLISLIPSLKLKTDFEIGVSDTAMGQLTATSRMLDEILNRLPQRNAAYVGESAFTHKGGLHVSALVKDSRTYEHIPPEVVGNRRNIVVSDQSGKSNIIAQLSNMGLNVDPKDPKINRLLDGVKAKDQEGLSFDGADASFELFAREVLYGPSSYYRLDRFRVIDERRWNADAETKIEAAAMVQLEVNGEPQMEAALGNGPVNALDTALRKALVTFYPTLATLRLMDYKVRILDGRSGTEAKTRVTIESQDDQGRLWTTVGVSTNIIDASFQALHDAITWKLIKDGVKPIARK